jgi:hypothetical protein
MLTILWRSRCGCDYDNGEHAELKQKEDQRQELQARQAGQASLLNTLAAGVPSSAAVQQSETQLKQGLQQVASSLQKYSEPNENGLQIGRPAAREILQSYQDTITGVKAAIARAETNAASCRNKLGVMQVTSNIILNGRNQLAGKYSTLTFGWLAAAKILFSCLLACTMANAQTAPAQASPALDHGQVGINIARVPDNASADRSGGFLITYVWRGSPAARAGLSPGDIIVAVNHESVLGKPTDQIPGLTGAAGETVSFTICRLCEHHFPVGQIGKHNPMV